MSNRGTIKIRWIRSGIAFNRKQKEAVRSLGLRRLHQVVELPDNPAVRGLAAKIAHLVEIVDGQNRPAPSSVPEYTLHRPAPAEAASAETEPRPALESQSAEVEPGNNL